MLPPTCVGSSISWVWLLSKTKSQKIFETLDPPDRVFQSMSGKLKSPRIMTDDVVEHNKRFCSAYTSKELGGR